MVKLAVAIRDLVSQMIRPAPGSIPGRCMILSKQLKLLIVLLSPYNSGSLLFLRSDVT